MYKLKIIGSSISMYFYCFKTSEGSLFGPEFYFYIAITLWKYKATTKIYFTKLSAENKKEENLLKNFKEKRWSFGK
jgi:hypothetical protein